MWNALKECKQQSTKSWIVLEDGQEKRNTVGYAKTKVTGSRISFVITTVPYSIH